jgi:hypothetical protein
MRGAFFLTPASELSRALMLIGMARLDLDNCLRNVNVRSRTSCAPRTVYILYKTACGLFEAGNWPVWHAIPVGLQNRPERMLIYDVGVGPLSAQPKKGPTQTRKNRSCLLSAAIRSVAFIVRLNGGNAGATEQR